MSHRSEVILFNYYPNNESKAELNSYLLSTYEFCLKEKRESLLKVSVTFPFQISIASAISEDIFLAFWVFQHSYLIFSLNNSSQEKWRVFKSYFWQS